MELGERREDLKERLAGKIRERKEKIRLRKEAAIPPLKPIDEVVQEQFSALSPGNVFTDVDGSSWRIKNIFEDRVGKEAYKMFQVENPETGEARKEGFHERDVKDILRTQIQKEREEKEREKPQPPRKRPRAKVSVIPSGKEAPDQEFLSKAKVSLHRLARPGVRVIIEETGQPEARRPSRRPPEGPPRPPEEGVQPPEQPPPPERPRRRRPEPAPEDPERRINDLLADIIRSDYYAVSEVESEATEKRKEIDRIIDQLPNKEDRERLRLMRNSVINIHDAYLTYDKHIAEGIQAGYKDADKFQGRYLNEVLDSAKLPGVARAWQLYEKHFRDLITNQNVPPGGWAGENPHQRVMSEANLNLIWKAVEEEIRQEAGENADAYARMGRMIWEYTGRYGRLSAFAFRESLMRGGQLTVEDFEDRPGSYGGKHFQERRLYGFDVWAYVEGIERFGPERARQVKNIITSESEDIRREFAQAVIRRNTLRAAGVPEDELPDLPIFYDTSSVIEWADYLPEVARNLIYRDGSRVNFSQYHERHFLHNNPFLEDLDIGNINFGLLAPNDEPGHWASADGFFGADDTRSKLTGRKEGENLLYSLHTDPQEVFWRYVKGENLWSHLGARYGEGRRYQKWMRIDRAVSKIQDENMPPRPSKEWKDTAEKLLNHGWHWEAKFRIYKLPYPTIEKASGLDRVILARMVLGTHEEDTILAYDRNIRGGLIEDALETGNTALANQLEGENDRQYMNWLVRLALNDPTARDPAADPQNQLRLARLARYEWSGIFPLDQAIYRNPILARLDQDDPNMDPYAKLQSALQMIDEMEYQPALRLMSANADQIDRIRERFLAGQHLNQILTDPNIVAEIHDPILDEPPVDSGEDRVDRRWIAHDDGLDTLAHTNPNPARRPSYETRFRTEFWPMERKDPIKQLERKMAEKSPENPANEVLNVLPTDEDWKKIVTDLEPVIGTKAARKFLNRLGYKRFSWSEWGRQKGWGKLTYPVSTMVSGWDAKNLVRGGGFWEKADDWVEEKMKERGKIGLLTPIPKLRPLDISFSLFLLYFFGGPFALPGITSFWAYSALSRKFGLGELYDWYVGRSKFAPKALRSWTSPYQKDPRLLSQLEQDIFRD